MQLAVDAVYEGDEDPVQKIRDEFEPQGMKVFAISAAKAEKFKELLYYVKRLLDTIDKDPVILGTGILPGRCIDYRKSTIYSCS